MGEVELEIKYFGIINDSFEHSRATCINCFSIFRAYFIECDIGLPDSVKVGNAVAACAFLN